MVDLDPALLETGRQIVRNWSESEGKGLALSIIIAKALQSEGDRRAEDMRERCKAKLAEHAALIGRGDDRSPEAYATGMALAHAADLVDTVPTEEAIRALPLEPTK